MTLHQFNEADEMSKQKQPGQELV